MENWGRLQIQAFPWEIKYRESQLLSWDQVFTLSLSKTWFPYTNPGLISVAKRDILLMNAKQEIVLNWVK